MKTQAPNSSHRTWRSRTTRMILCTLSVCALSSTALAQNHSPFVPDCSAALNAHQLTVSKTRAAPATRFVGPEGPAHATGDSVGCGDMTYVGVDGLFDTLTFTPLFGGPNVVSADWDCQHSSIIYSLYTKNSAGIYSLATNGDLFGAIVGTTCTHVATNFPSTGSNAATVAHGRDSVFAVVSWTHNDPALGHPGNLCSTTNCWWPTQVFVAGKQHRFIDQDYDGDGRNDEVVFRSGTWFVHPTGGGSDLVTTFGTSTDLLVPADYDGDGKTDVAVFRPSNGNWFAHLSGGGPDMVKNWGNSTDRTVPGDYDGDGLADPAIFRPSNGTWFALLSSGGSTSVQFGTSTDVVVPGDYDGDGKTDPAVFRPSNGTWFAHLSGGGPDLSIQFGVSSDIPVPGDYDGDGKADVAVFRPSSGTWFAHLSGGGPDLSIQFGTSAFRRVRGDYDGDGKTDVAVFNPANGTWFAHLSGGGPDLSIQFGVSSDRIPYQN
jgi:hypothetical protein